MSEELLFGDPANFIEPIKSIQKAGLSVAIDDIGFGRSSLENLLVLEADIIKIDKKMVIGISKDQGRLRSLKRLLKMVTTLNVGVVAEGIENEEDLKVLQDLGVTYGQGFLWGKPV